MIKKIATKGNHLFNPPLSEGGLDQVGRGEGGDGEGHWRGLREGGRGKVNLQIQTLAYHFFSFNQVIFH